MTADQLVKLLAAKHAEDVFIPQCKDGPSGSFFSQLDAWVMEKSWSHPTTYGYEVKVARNDFLRDNKWQRYLPLCSDFYFVCPPGLIQPDECSPDAGLLWASATGSRLFVKKKAPRRQVTVPDALFRYVIMRLDSEGNARRRSRADAAYWREWLERKAADQELGHKVSARLRRLVSERIDRVEAENHRLRAENEALADVRKLIESMGLKVDAGRWPPLADRVKRQAQELERQFPEGTVHALREAIRGLESVLALVVKGREP